MQTFLPSIDYNQSAKWLDRPGRLGKQRLEGLDCLKLNLHFNYDIPREELDFPEFLIKRYGNHSCRKMWSGYEWSLWWYCHAIIIEWREVGYKDNCFRELQRLEKYIDFSDTPPWLTEEFASNHRAVLLGKAKETVKDAAEKLNINWGPDDYSEVIQDRQYTKFKKAREVTIWYQQWDWTERPAERVMRNGKLVWPYLWPEKED